VKVSIQGMSVAFSIKTDVLCYVGFCIPLYGQTSMEGKIKVRRNVKNFRNELGFPQNKVFSFFVLT
jgi:hypothetical protein